MKLLLCLFMFTGMTGLHSVEPLDPPSPGVLAVFEGTFDNPDSVQWFTVSGDCVAVFTKNSIRTSIRYDKDGHFKSSKRYYDVQNLPLNILLKVRNQYKGAAIGIVTEIIEQDDIAYFINLKDSQHVFLIKSGADGAIVQLSKRQRAD